MYDSFQLRSIVWSAVLCNYYGGIVFGIYVLYDNEAESWLIDEVAVKFESIDYPTNYCY